MADASVNVTDKNELKDWLGELPHKSRIAFVGRVALRILPFTFQERVQKSREYVGSKLVLACFRSTLTSGVIALDPSSKIESRLIEASANAATAASAAAASASRATATAAASAATAAAAAAITVVNAQNANAAAEASAKANSNAFRASAPSAAAKNDAQFLIGSPSAWTTLMKQKLWTDVEVPSRTQSFVDSFVETSEGTAWAFWSDWYQSMLDGTPLDWDLQRRVALIPDDVWEKGVEAVAEKIAELRKPDVNEKDVKTQVQKLLEAPQSVEVTAIGLADVVDQTIHDVMRDIDANALPEEFQVLHSIPPILRGIARTVVVPPSSEREEQLKAEVQALHARISELEQALAEARAKTLTGTMSKAFWDQAGKSLGDWKMWGALIGGGYVMLGDGTLSAVVDTLADRTRDLFPKSGVVVEPIEPKDPFGGVDV